MGHLVFLLEKIVSFGDGDRGLLQIDVCPRQRGGLAAAQAGVEQQHGCTLGGVRRFADPALLLVGDGCADLRRRTGRTGGFCDGVVQDHLGDGKIVGGLGAAAQIGQGKVRKRRVTIVSGGKLVQPALKVCRF